MSFTALQRALGYLKGLPGTTFTKLYQQPSTALVVFRRIPPYLAKKIVMGMLYMNPLKCSTEGLSAHCR
jgi:transcription initiation factor TFIIH subunit 4